MIETITRVAFAILCLTFVVWLLGKVLPSEFSIFPVATLDSFLSGLTGVFQSIMGLFGDFVDWDFFLVIFKIMAGAYIGLVSFKVAVFVINVASGGGA